MRTIKVYSNSAARTSDHTRFSMQGSSNLTRSRQLETSMGKVFAWARGGMARSLHTSSRPLHTQGVFFGGDFRTHVFPEGSLSSRANCVVTTYDCKSLPHEVSVLVWISSKRRLGVNGDRCVHSPITSLQEFVRLRKIWQSKKLAMASGSFRPSNLSPGGAEEKGFARFDEAIAPVQNRR